MLMCNYLKFTIQMRWACFGRLSQWILKPTKRQFSTCRKLNKEHLTALVCASADGSHHLKQVIIGKLSKPQPLRCIVKDLPVIYMTNKKAWATQELSSNRFPIHFVHKVEEHQIHNLNMNLKSWKPCCYWAVLLLTTQLICWETRIEI